MVTAVTAGAGVVVFAVIMAFLAYCAVFDFPEMALVAVHAVAVGV